MSETTIEAHIYQEKLAQIYDIIYKFKNYQKDIEYIDSCIKKTTPHASTLLEVAVGTGNYAGELAKMYQVEGLELSSAMIERVQEKHPEVLVHQGDMVEFDLGKTFDVVCCLFRSIAFTGTRENFKRSILCMARHVRPGGLLLVEPFFTPDTYWTGDLKMNLTDEDDVKIAWMYVSERKGDLGIMKNHFLVGRSSGVEHFIETHEMALFGREDYEQAFSAAGLDLYYDDMGPSGIGLYIGQRSVGEK